MYRQDVDTAAGRALFAVISIPGGSTLARVTADGSATREDATRGLLTFTAGSPVYMVSNQESPLRLAGSRTRSLDERAAPLLADLQQVVAGMTFR